MRTVKRLRPGRPAAKPGRDARVLLIDAAARLFAEQGVAATSFTTVARRAKLTPAMVHYYFRDRDELLDAVVAERIVPVIAFVWEPLQPGDDPGAMIRGLIDRLVEATKREPWLPTTWVREILNESGLLRQRVFQHIPMEKVRTLGDAIRAGQRKHVLNRNLHPLLSVFSVLGLVMLQMATVTVWAELFHRPTPTAEQLRRHLTALVLDGLTHNPDRPDWSKSGNVLRSKQ